MSRLAVLPAFFFLLATVSVYGQTMAVLPTDSLYLEATVISSDKIGRNVSEIPAKTNIATSFEIKAGSSFTIADVLKSKPGLSKGGDGIWATNINLRGMSENRLVTLIDRNRVEVATDLTTSLSMIDVNDIERVEVINGAQSSIYGSGAIGGIINVVTKDGHFSDAPYFNGSFATSYSSVNNGIGEYLSLYGGGSKWYVKVNGSFSGAGDVNTPEGILKNSRYRTCNAGAIAAFKPATNQILKAQVQFNHSWNVGIPGGAAFSPTATVSYKRADRTMADLNYEISDISRYFEKLAIKCWYQGILLDVEMLPNVPKVDDGAVPTTVLPSASHRSFGVDAESRWNLSEWNTLIVGAEMWQRRISSDRNKYIDQYSAGKRVAQMIRNERPLPNASFTSSGLFAQDQMQFFGNRLILSFGGRADVNVVRNGECHNVEYVMNVATGDINANPPGKYVTFPSGVRTDFSWSANAGLLYKAGRKFDLVLNLSRSYRSPALEELFKFIDLAGNKIHFGNPSLKSEKGIGGDVGFRFHGDRLVFNISAYASRMRDMIVERRMNSVPTSEIDTLVLDNASKALLFGFDAEISYRVAYGLKIYASGAWTIGREISNEWAWLPLIPPLNGRAGVSYENSGILGADLSVSAAGARKIGQTAAGERPTDAWCRLDFSIHSKIFSLGRCNLQLFGGIDNITNADYTNFLSTNRGNIICEPGRNFFLRANLSF